MLTSSITSMLLNVHYFWYYGNTIILSWMFASPCRSLILRPNKESIITCSV
jgi:hypothetical protein